MPHVVFIAPHFLENTNRYLSAFAALHGVTLSVVSEDPESAIPTALQGRIALHYRVDQSLDAEQLTRAVRWIHARERVDRLTGGLEQLQMPMAIVRDALDLEGLRTETARAFRDKDRMKEVLRAAGVPVAASTLDVMGHRRSYWEKLVAELEAGASLAEVAVRHDVHPKTLSWWRTVFRRAKPADKVRVAPTDELRIVPVVHASRPITGSTTRIEVAVGSFVVRVDESVDVAYVARLARALAC